MSRHRVRRDARRIRRYGVEPMMLLSDDMSFAPVAFVAFTSWLWHYRSELAPFAVALLAEIAAVTLHITHREWAAPVGIGTALVALAVAVFGGTMRLRGSERLYAATVIVACGGWTAIATSAGPGRSPLPAVLAVGGLVLAVPWWVHRRRRTRVRVDRTLAAWPDISEAVGLAGSRIQSVVVDVWGYRARLGLARGQTVEDALDRVSALESALGTRRGAVRVQPVPEKANRAELRVIETDPHANAIAWPGPSVTSITQPVELGVFEDGTAVRVSFLRRHGLLAGIAGAGKSGGVNVLMGNLSACPDAIVWGIDLKRGMELLPWAACLDRIATTPREADTLLSDAVAILDGRAELLAMQGLRVWEPALDAPALILLIDEYAELVDEAPDAVAWADSIARRGRAPAVTLIAATQRPSQKAMGSGAVRSQMDVRISFRVRERRDVDLILGQGMHRAGWHADRLDAPGKFLISAPEHDIPRRARAYLLDDDQVQRTAHRHTIRRPTLDTVSMTALESVTGPDSLSGNQTATRGRHFHNPDPAPEALLWDALTAAPKDGLNIADLAAATQMGRSWIYYRLQEHLRAGHAVQPSRGRWRAAAEPSTDTPGDHEP
ncbi:cell division protein FtsK [Streptosporangiaceae bacterium NEAU-GS5]|nr:cell division protein FtsK [Streptosporangiaceae bacterium NEAU-GS5]